MRAALLLSLSLLVIPGAAGAAGPTDIARVDDYIVRAAGRPLPYGLDVGAPRTRVEAVLGQAQDTTDERAFYLDADGFPNSVEFFFRDGRVTRIEWRFWAD